MNEQQLKEAFMQYLQQKSGAQTQQEFEAYIQQLGEEGLQQEYTQFMQMMRQQVAARKFGGMLNYVGKLRGVCPEGYEMQFFKQGGQICKKCVQKAKMEEGGKTPQNPVDAFKCGRKMKKKACGGSMDKKVSKHLFGGKQRRPFTGFEGLSYEYEAPNHSLQGRAQRPETETIRNNGKFLQSRETWYDPEAYNNTGKLQIEDQGYSIGDGVETEWEPTDQQRRTFNSLKRHALMNQQLARPMFEQGGLVRKKKR